MDETEVLSPDTSLDDTASDTPPEPDADELETEDTGKDLEAAVEAARKETEARIRAEVEEERVISSFKAGLQEADRWVADGGVAELQKLVAWAYEEAEDKGKKLPEILAQLNPDNLKKGPAGRLATFAMLSSYQQTEAIQDAELAKEFPDWRIPQDLQREREKALAARDPIALQRIRNRIYTAAVMENRVPEAAKKFADEQAAKNKKGEQVAGTQRSDREKATEGRPLTGTGASSSPRYSLAQIDKMSTSEWLNIDPDPKVRQKILDDAHAAADRRR